VAAGTFAGPLSKLAVRVSVPATVPVRSITGDANVAAVCPAGIVKLTILEPVENCTAGSSLGTSALDVNESVNCPVNVLG